MALERSDAVPERVSGNRERNEIPARAFAYAFLAGPMETPDALSSDWCEGNCRRAVQWYLYEMRGVFLRPEQVLLPQGFRETGTWVIREGELFQFEKMRGGDIIYAERIQNARGETVDASRMVFASEDEYRIALHTAIYTGRNGHDIWHATPIAGDACTWDIPTFLQFYKPIAAKRV